MPGVLLGLAVVSAGCVGLQVLHLLAAEVGGYMAGKADRLLDGLRDVSVYGDGNPVPPHVHEHARARPGVKGPSPSPLLTSAVLAGASLAGFAGIAVARAGNRRARYAGHAA